MVILGPRRDTPFEPVGEGAGKELCAEERQPGGQLAPCFVGHDWRGHLRENGACVETRVHLHDGYPGIVVAVEDGSLRWCGAPPARQ